MSRVCRIALATFVVAILAGLGSASASAQYYDPSYDPRIPYEASPFNRIAPPPPVVSSEVPWYGQYEATGVPPAALGRPRRIDEWYFRGEYINFRFQGPESVSLGAPVLGITDPSLPFPVTDPTGTIVLGQGRVPTLDSIQLNSVSGFRGTIGTELTAGGAFEVSAFITQKQTGSFVEPNLAGGGNLIVTSTLLNDQIGNNLEIYNRAFRADYSTQMWGAEANYFGEFDNIGLFQLKPLVGARYLRFSEELNQRGTFNAGPGLRDINTAIDSTSYNNLAGPQVGLRGEIVSDFVVLSADTKFGALVNSGKNSIFVENFRSNFDPAISNEDHFTNWCPTVDVGVSGRFNITQNWNIRIGYQFLFLTNVVRPGQSIVYNITAPEPEPVAFRSQATYSNFYAHGFSFGTEFRW